MTNKLTRRSFVSAATVGSASIFVKSLRAADFNFIQYHNQPATSSLHQRLAEMWTAIRTETDGRVDTQIFPQNNKLPGSDPAALKMLVAGEIQFFTIMGGLLSNVVPVADVQQVPFAFRSAPDAHRAMDGPLGAYVRAEMAAKGIAGFPVGAFDNGIRQVASNRRPILVPNDLIGLRMRIPAGQMFEDLFRSLGAEPIVVNSDSIYDALKSGKVDAQENPLALVDLFKLYEVVKYVSMTNHMWSGFNLLAHLATWNRLPENVKAVIDRNVTKYVRLQRQDQESANARLRADLARRGLVFNDVDAAPFRKRLSGFYATWKGKLGTKCWSLLEVATGALG
jgi:tripartite ATP-independent transporter DctP family solute receptor